MSLAVSTLTPNGSVAASSLKRLAVTSTGGSLPASIAGADCALAIPLAKPSSDSINNGACGSVPRRAGVRGAEASMEVAIME